MIKIKSYDANTDTLIFQCECNEDCQVDLTRINELSFLEQFNEYENISHECLHCRRLHYFNANIPISEYEERVFEEVTFQYNEINDRKILRDILWKKRSDLKKIDRTTYNEGKKYIFEKDKEKVEELKRQLDFDKPPRNLQTENQ